MKVKLKPKAEATFEAFRVNDDNLPALIRKIGEVVQIDTHASGALYLTCAFQDGRFLSASEGQYVVFSDDKTEVLSEAKFNERYESAEDDFYDPTALGY